MDAVLKLLSDSRSLRKNQAQVEDIHKFVKSGSAADRKNAFGILRDAAAAFEGASAEFMFNAITETGHRQDFLNHLLPLLADPESRQLALRYLPHFRQDAYASLARLGRDPNQALREGAVLAINSMANSRIRGWDPAVDAGGLAQILIDLLNGDDLGLIITAGTALPPLAKAINGDLRPLLNENLRKSVTNKNQFIRGTGFALIGRLGLAAEFTTEIIRALLEDHADSVKIAAAAAVLGQSDKDRELIGPFCKILTDAKAERGVKLAALAAIVRLQDSRKLTLTDAETAMLAASLAAVLGGTDEPVVLKSAQILGSLGTAAIEHIGKALHEDTPQAKRFAAFAAAKAGAAAASLAGDLAGLLSDKAPLVRRNATEALGIVSGAAAKDLLLKMLADPDLRVSETAAAALNSFLADDAESKNAVAKYRAALAKKNVSEAAPDDTGKYPADRYLVGGALAGIELPLFPPQHGEVSGYPGTIPELAEKAAAENARLVAEGKAKPAEVVNMEFTPVGLAPHLQLYKDSVEHYHTYWSKYCPVRSFFDEQSQLRNWSAGKLPGTKARTEEYAEPIHWIPRWAGSKATGYRRAPVTVQRYGKQDAPVQLDLGVLQPGAYTVRVIAAVPTENVQWFRKPLVIRLKVNDGVGGGENEYALRSNYTDEFYSICEFSFNTPEQRAYSAKLWLDPESEVEILIHNICLDDAMTGVVRRAVKTRMTMHELKHTGMAVDPKSVKNPARPLLAEERDLRDQWLWNSFPPANAQGTAQGYRMPAAITHAPGARPEGAIAGPVGTWAGIMPFDRSQFKPTPADPDAWLHNDILGLTYSVQDLHAGRPLPEPYPYKDRGYGLVWQDENEPGKKGRVLSVIGDAVDDYYRLYPDAYIKSCDKWAATGNNDDAHDAAVALARRAYAFPAMITADIGLNDKLADQGVTGQQGRFHKRGTNNSFYSWYTKYGTTEIDAYDRLYPFIENNWAVAGAVGRFVPWVKTPRDVIKLIDTHLIQMTAKKILRYNWYTGEMKIAKLAAVLGDNDFTDPWMEWLFAAASVYPFPVAGLEDLIVSGCTREGTEYVASTMYARGENALPKAAALVDYLKAGGNPKYDLSDPLRYPKPLSTCHWLFDSNVAGLNFLRVGDVTGPDKARGQGWKAIGEGSRWGWSWSKEPYFAHALANYFPEQQKEFTAAEWAKIEAAAKSVSRPRWLELKSRSMPQWAAVLETGLEHDDYRFRRAVAIRTGMGWGHHHNDGLDLQLYAHGTMMTTDGGQRPGYSRPADRSTRMHNLVEVDNAEWLVHNWTNALSDGTNAKYVRNTAIPPKGFEHVNLYQRQTALLDIDEGEGSEKLSLAQMGMDTKGLKTGIRTANSYVFDVFRVAGGSRHTYCFHATLSEKVTNNSLSPVKFEQLPELDKAYIERMAGERLAGTAPAKLEVDFQLDAGQVKKDLPKEMHAGLANYHTRLHLPGHAGARVLRGSLNCTKWGYQIPMVFIQNRAPDETAENPAKDLETAFAAVIEPYVGTPVIAAVERLEIAGNETDARQAVAIRVKTVNGNNDICFADGRPEKERSLPGATVSAEFAYLSNDRDGLRQASLSGGTKLAAANLLILADTSEYTGKITAVDYQQKTMTLDAAWPAITFRPTVFEVGTANHWTAYHALEFNRADNQTQIRVKDGADYYLSRVKAIDSQTNTVTCALGFGSGTEGLPAPGIDKHWVASNEDGSKWWRAEFLGGNIGLGEFKFKLTGAPATMADFGRNKAFRLWEYGPGDSVRHSTFVALSRQAPGTYLVEADVSCRIGMLGKQIATSADGRNWKRAEAEHKDGLVITAISINNLQDGRIYIKVD